MSSSAWMNGMSLSCRTLTASPLEVVKEKRRVSAASPRPPARQDAATHRRQKNRRRGEPLFAIHIQDDLVFLPQVFFRAFHDIVGRDLAQALELDVKKIQLAEHL